MRYRRSSSVEYLPGAAIPMLCRAAWDVFSARSLAKGESHGECEEAWEGDVHEAADRTRGESRRRHSGR
jgi:hypothetical protein